MKLQNTERGAFMKTLEITKTNFESKVISADIPVLIDFWAPWCGPCRMMGPVIDEIADEKKTIVVGKVNIDEQPELAQTFGIVSIPTLVILNKGKIVHQITGVRPKDQITSLLEG